MCRPLRVPLLHRGDDAGLACNNCGWSWKEAIGRTTRNWAGPMLLLESFAMPSSPLAFALPELGRHLINLYLEVFTILLIAWHGSQLE
jgi:hypothetical protein